MTGTTMRDNRAASRSRFVSRSALASVCFGAFLLSAAPAQAGCVDHIVAAEKENDIPKGLLLAVSLVESGGSGTPNPYIMNVRGRVVVPNSEAEAARYLRDSKGNLRSSVYAGCMQLSLTHHKDAFRPVEKIVNPESNVRYAAKFLVALRRETGSWAGAVARYNGASRPEAVAAYQCKVQRQLVNLGADTSAALVGSGDCAATEVPAVAPRTRRALHRVTETPVS